MIWVIVLSVVIVIVIVIAIVNGTSSNSTLYRSSITSSTAYGQHDMVSKLLELVERKGNIVVDSYADSQHSKNKIGWYLNSYQFFKDYNQSDKYIADVDFFDNVKRVGDVKRIILRLNPNPQPIEIKEEPHVYKSSQIKQQYIKGLEYRGLTNNHLGKFYGYVKTEPDNKYDKYAIAIFNDKDQHIGYLPKEEEYLFNTLELIGGKQQAWGYIYKEIHTYSGTEKLHGRVYIPIKCSKAKIEKAISEFKTKRPRKVVKI